PYPASPSVTHLPVRTSPMPRHPHPNPIRTPCRSSRACLALRHPPRRPSPPSPSVTHLPLPHLPPPPSPASPSLTHLALAFISLSTYPSFINAFLNKQTLNTNYIRLFQSIPNYLQNPCKFPKHMLHLPTEPSISMRPPQCVPRNATHLSL